MSMEDWALQLEGLDPKVIHRAADSLVHLLGVVKAQIEPIGHLLDTIKAELPRIQQLAADVQSQIAAYEAKQRQINGR